MPFEFEALVGYLYIVGGRSISAPPPGTLVEVAPKKAARGRESDTFFTLVIPSGETVAPAAFYEEMARTGADQYFGSAGSVTAGIKTVFTHMNNNLYEHNNSDPRHYEASMFCAVLRGTDLYVGKVGAGVGLLRQDGDAQPFPTDFSYREALNTPPLGVQTDAEIRMGRYQVKGGTRLLVADSALLDFSMDALKEAIGLEDIGAVLARLRENAKRQITAMAVEFVLPEQSVTLPARTGDSTAAITGAAAPTATEAPTGSKEAPAVNAIRRSPRRGALARRIGAGLARFGARIADGMLRLLDRLLPTPPEGKKSWLSSPVAAGIAVLIPVVVVVAVILFWVSGTGASEFDQCVTRATTAAATARGIASNDVDGTLAAWNGVMAVVNECNDVRPGDPTIAALQSEASSVLDRLQDITRVPITPIYAFPNAMLTQAVLQGEDMYVLDSANEQVYRITLTTDGMGVLANSYTPIPAMRRSGKVINFDISDLIDIAWADIGAGLSQSNVITAMDKKGVLVACPPGFLQDCTAQQLPGQDMWKTPVAIQFWEGRLYLLDPSANQIWRYDPSGGTFSGIPLEYFAGTDRPDLSTAIDFSINSAGDIYLLLNTGVVARFRGGEQQDFSFSGFDVQKMASPNALYLNTNPIAQGLYFVEQDKRTIFETTMAGTFIHAYRAQDDDLFAQVNNVVADTNQGVVYALSGNSILAFPRRQ